MRLIVKSPTWTQFGLKSCLISGSEWHDSCIDVQQVELSTYFERAYLKCVDCPHMSLTYIMFMYVYVFLLLC